MYNREKTYLLKDFCNLCIRSADNRVHEGENAARLIPSWIGSPPFARGYLFFALCQNVFIFFPR